MEVQAVWSAIEFLMNCLAFILIGLELNDIIDDNDDEEEEELTHLGKPLSEADDYRPDDDDEDGLCELCEKVESECARRSSSRERVA